MNKVAWDWESHPRALQVAQTAAEQFAWFQLWGGRNASPYAATVQSTTGPHPERRM